MKSLTIVALLLAACVTGGTTAATTASAPSAAVVLEVESYSTARVSVQAKQDGQPVSGTVHLDTHQSGKAPLWSSLRPERPIVVSVRELGGQTYTTRGIYLPTERGAVVVVVGARQHMTTVAFRPAD